jgi:hypothetical protein
LVVSAVRGERRHRLELDNGDRTAIRIADDLERGAITTSPSVPV